MSERDPKNKKPRVFDLPGTTPDKRKKETTNKPKRAAAKKTTAPKAQDKNFEEAETNRPRAIEVADVELTNDVIDQLDQPVPAATSNKRRIGWGSILLSALGTLAALALGLAIDQLVRDLFTRHEWLGWFALALTLLIVVAALIIIAREVAALLRLQKIESIREGAESVCENNELEAVQKVEREVAALYTNRVDMAAARTAYAAFDDDVVSPKDRIGLIERELLSPLDQRAEELVMNAAKKVAIVTAVSPRALIDILYVLAENLRLIRAISELYGGKPGMVGFWRLTKSVVSHLAITGAISIGDGLLQQMVGHGLAARLSARFGEGVINGLLTARIGLAAHDICRPIPFIHKPRPSISKVLNSLIGLVGSDKQK